MDSKNQSVLILRLGQAFMGFIVLFSSKQSTLIVNNTIQVRFLKLSKRLWFCPSFGEIHNIFLIVIQQFIRWVFDCVIYKVQTFFYRFRGMSQPELPQLSNQQLIIAPAGSKASKLSGLFMEAGALGGRRECRVCLQGEKEGAGNALLSTCLCSGSLQHVHRVCLQAWLLRKYQEEETKASFSGGQDAQQFLCEICCSPYRVDFSVEWAWVDCATFIGKLRANVCVAVVNVLFVVLDLLCLVLSSCYAVADSRKEEFDARQAKYFLVYVAILLALTSALYGVYQFVRVFLIQQRIVVRGESKSVRCLTVPASQEKEEGKTEDCA